ncbi:MAG: multicopper oxidase domain-containing protein [Gammaproteobacteria bacterium]|nr:multicopper oxidase domain-containing protein [Gammaproteobacteria bacterium]
MKIITRGFAAAAFSLLFVPFGANAQDSSIYVQCPTQTRLHPDTDANPDTRENGIKCDHISAGDGIVTMANDGAKQQYVFGFSRLTLPGVNGAPTQESGQYPGYIMDQGMLAANAPAPTISVDEDDELFLSLTNVGMAMRPDLFDPHTIHWHGFPNASAVFDGLPDSGIAIAGGATLTYYYNAKDAGTYMYHCHVEATEHMQMGMLGSLFVRPRQNRCDTITAADPGFGLPGSTCPPGHTPGDKYAFDDGDGSTRYDKDIAIQFGSFDPDFHDASFGVQPLPFAAMRDRYFLLNGRGYPDTTNTAALSTLDPLGRTQVSQPLSSLITAAPGQRILLRLSNLSVTAFYTVGTSGLTMEVVGLDARLLRDDDGNNMYYLTNSVTLGGGQSADVIVTIPTTATPGATTYFLYTKNLDLLANDAENFGGMMTEIQIN